MKDLIMSFKLKETVMYKEDPLKAGILFSIENKNDHFLKIKGVAQTFINNMLAGKSYEETREITLSEYNVAPDVLDQDLLILENKLKEIDFIVSK